MKFFAALLMLWCCPVWAEWWAEDTPLPQNAMLRPTLANIDRYGEKLLNVVVLADMRLGAENPRWEMSQTLMQVFLHRLANLPQSPRPEDEIWTKLPRKEPNYRGLILLISTVDGKRFMPVRVFEGKITVVAGGGVADMNGAVLADDYGRMMEYWLFGTARVRRDQLLGVNVSPVISFEQCKLMGQKVVETTPRQCLLPDNNLLLKMRESPSLKSARIKSFEQCLERDGTALIYTFPRRCVADGGRVFTEPPRLPDWQPKLLVPVAVEVSLGTAVSGSVVSPTTAGAEPLNKLELNSALVAAMRMISGTVLVSSSQTMSPVVVSGTVVASPTVQKYNWNQLGK